ncbi:PFAM FAD binding domain [Fragilaria crotonensis]|nr:PFAM FAD binding domain [Fragilaria crotonensis]
MHVIIVGCSLAGLSCALGLLSNGHGDSITIDIIEKCEDLHERRGATFGLAQNGQIALQEMCPQVLEEVRKIGILMEFTTSYMVPWWEVRDALLRAAQQDHRIVIHFGMKIQDVDEDDNHVRVSFSNSNRILRGSVLVGADGVHSYIRTHVLGLPPPVSTGAFVWRGSVDASAVPSLNSLLTEIPDAKLVVFGSKLLLFYFNFHKTRPGILAWTVSSMAPGIIPGETTPLDLIEEYRQEESTNNAGDETSRESDIESAIAVFNASPLSALTTSSQLSVVDLEQQTQWGGKGRITLIGDAAHAIRPTDGQGGSMAFEDAAILSRLLKECAAATAAARDEGATSSTDETSAHDAAILALREFESRRLNRVKCISKDQSRRAEARYRNEDMPPWSDMYREWVFAGPDASNEPPS